MSKAGILLLMFGGWSLTSYLTSRESLTSALTSRKLMSADDDGVEDAGDYDYVEERSDKPEIVTRVELLPQTNISEGPCVEPAVKQFPSPILGKSSLCRDDIHNSLNFRKISETARGSSASCHHCCLHVHWSGHCL